jgi:hypothetical protein
MRVQLSDSASTCRSERTGVSKCLTVNVRSGLPICIRGSPTRPLRALTIFPAGLDSVAQPQLTKIAARHAVRLIASPWYLEDITMTEPKTDVGYRLGRNER